MVEIWDPAGRIAGTGYLITDHLVLTAYHNIERADARSGRAVEVRRLALHGEDQAAWAAAEVLWPEQPPHLELDPHTDAALLLITDRQWQPPVSLPPVRWGRLPSAVPGAAQLRIPCVAVGFPRAEERDGSRDTKHIQGHIEALSGLKSGLITAHIDQVAVPRPAGAESSWSGASGAALFCGHLLVGILTTDRTLHYSGSQLVAVPVATLVDRRGFLSTVKAAGNSLDLEEVSLPAGAGTVAVPVTGRRRAVRNLDRAAIQLQEDVLARASHAVARLGLQQPTLIEVSWKGSGRFGQPSQEVLGVVAEEMSGTVSQVPELCRRLPRHQLIVLGAAGTGKSVIALHLVQSMLKNPQPGDPIPVLMSLSSWRPGVPMQDWMIRQIRQNNTKAVRHWRSKTDAARLFAAGEVMPVLDGLDELPESLRAKAVEAIDKAIPTNCWLLLTSRGDEYEEVCRAGSHLTRAAVVELDAVGVEAAITYLEQSQVAGDDRWNTVFDHLRRESESEQAQLMASPLMLYLAKTTYRKLLTDPKELISKKHSQEDIAAALLDRYLPAIYTDDPRGRYKEKRARRHLQLMARQMVRDETVDFAWWQLNAKLTGLLVGLAFGAVWGLFMQALFGPVVGAVTGVLAGGGGWAAHAMVRSDLKQVYVPEHGEHGQKTLLIRYSLIGGATALVVTGAAGASTALWLSRVLGAEAPLAWCYGAIVGAALGIATLLGSAWGSYQVSRCWFWGTGRLPWRLLPFLQNANELGVLRQIGAVYQFRHDRLLRQLAGRTPEKPSRSAHGQWDAKWQRWRPFLPVFASLVQIGSALCGLAMVSLIYAASTQIELRYQSGDEPGVRVDSSMCQSGVDCVGVPIWSWKLPQRSSRHTVLMPSNLHGRSIRSWGGAFEADGCPGATVRVTLTLRGEAPATFTLNNSARTTTAELPRPAPPRRQPVSLELDRVDDLSCSLLVEWTGPGLIDDGLEPARRRLGVDTTGMS
ncbi:NACHT domain-containing protein [Streptomyces sp. NPDC008163]|uniref:NACHT domain-containing protein n=1 Tax=Streptomyces sp. NPDC008163 TaxID=3364818 RepID=UPI0036EC527B